MIAISTRQPLRVCKADPERPYLVLPDSQLDRLRAILDENQIRYSISPVSVSWEGAPSETFVYFDYGTDAKRVQRILDGVP